MVNEIIIPVNCLAPPGLCVLELLKVVLHWFWKLPVFYLLEPGQVKRVWQLTAYSERMNILLEI